MMTEANNNARQTSFTVPPAALEVAGTTKSRFLSWSAIRPIIYLTTLVVALYVLSYALPNSISIPWPNALSTPIASFRLFSDPFVIAGCGVVTLWMFWAIARETTARSQFLHKMRSIERDFIARSNHEFSEYLVTLRGRCHSDRNVRHFDFNRQLMCFIDDLQPAQYDPQPYAPVTARYTIDPHVIYRSGLYATADNLVRVALFMTFLALTWALVSTAQRLPDFSLLTSKDAINVDAANAVIAKTSSLVTDLITVASFKFFISAYGLLMSIVTRLIASSMETKVSSRIIQFADRLTDASDNFLRARSNGTLGTQQTKPMDLRIAIAELTRAISDNTTVTKDIIRLVVSRKSHGPK